jgi:hypothetical protein
MFLAVHCALVVHAAHALFVQTGAVPLQLVLLKHCTQRFVVVLQEGVEPEHWAVLVAVHFTHEPPVLHAGAAAPFRALHSASPVVGGLPCVQPRQVKEAASQMGVVAVAQLAEARQATQAPVWVRQ